MSTASDAIDGAIAALIDRGDEKGCVTLSEVDELTHALELDDGDLGRIYETLDARGIEMRDDCGRDTPVLPVDDAALATTTTDTLQLFLNEIGRHRLLKGLE
jgi:RNA polymerase primary sigma factor